MLPELKQKPFTSLEEEAHLNAVHTAEHLMSGEVEVLKSAKLSFAQYNVLRVLRGAGKTGLSCTEICDRMLRRDPDMTRLLDRLEKRGYASRARLKTDRRVVLVRITPRGLALIHSLDAPMNEAQRKQLKHMSRKQLQTLIELLELARHPPV